MNTRYIPKNYKQFIPNLPEYPKMKFECYVDLEENKAIFFIGKQSNPSWNYRFKDTVSMKEKIISSIKSLMAREEIKEERKNKRLEPTTMKEGDILYSTWGYEQTNVDFYQVTKVLGKRTVEIREIAQVRNTENMPFDQYKATPIPNRFIGSPIKKQVAFNKYINLNSYASARLYNGEAISGSCYA